MRISIEQLIPLLTESEANIRGDFEGELLLLTQEPPSEEEELIQPGESANLEDPNKLLWLSLQEKSIQQAETTEQPEATPTVTPVQHTEVERSPLASPALREVLRQEMTAEQTEGTAPKQTEGAAPKPIEDHDEAPKTYERAARAELRREKLEADARITTPTPESALRTEAEPESLQRMIPMEWEVERPKRSAEIAPPAQALRLIEADPDPIARVSEEIKVAPLLQPEATQSSQRVQLVIGEGEQQVRLSVFANEHQVKVTTQSAPPELMRAMQGSVSELQASLQQHGLSLSHFGSGSQEQRPGQQERAPEEEPPKRAEAQVKKRARAIL